MSTYADSFYYIKALFMTLNFDSGNWKGISKNAGYSSVYAKYYGVKYLQIFKEETLLPSFGIPFVFQENLWWLFNFCCFT